MSKNFGDISEKHRLSAGSDTIFVTDYRSTEIAVIVEKLPIFLHLSVFKPIFREIPRYFLPVQPAHRIQNMFNFFFILKKHKMLFGNLIMICRQRLYFSAWLKNRGWFVTVKSNGKKAKRPLEQIQKTQGAKKNSNFFGFPLGFCMDFLGNQTRMNFPGNRMGDGFSWESNGVWKKKKKIIITWLD